MTPNSIQSNQLIEASSPYLLQHAQNPVHWQEWNEETLNTAKRLNKPILLSIGYAACHWCHVMAHESFEDEKTASIMNDLFINIKVDREERPDIDQIYMAALHALGEQGGWPLTMFLKPDGSPFWGGTYFPPFPTHGRPAFTQVLNSIHKAFIENISDIEKNADALTNHLKTLSLSPITSEVPDVSNLEQFSDRVLSIYDPIKGGIKGAPKFPNAPMVEVWARASKGRSDNVHAKAFIHSIKEISLGGIYDHLRGGIARYSVDDSWLVPHFEKMLYDNAHYLKHLLICWQFSKEDLFRIRIDETIGWLKEEMLLEAGAFASSLDADSEGVEGKFYVWNYDEIQSVITDKDQFTQFSELYDISKSGNWETVNILNLSESKDIDASNHENIRAIKQKLLEHRNKRIRPGLDDKILVDWNSYLIRALAEISSVFQEKQYLELALKAFHFISESNGSELFHSTRSNKTIKLALSSDYAAMINAALSLYEATQNSEYLNTAQNWFELLDQHYTDGKGGFFLTSTESTDLLIRPRCDQDEANPSASSQILEAMVRFANLSGNISFLAKAEKLVKNQEAISKINKYGMAGYMNGLDSFFNHVHILISGSDSTERSELLMTARNLPIIAKTIVIKNMDQQHTHNNIELPETDQRACVVICSKQTCSAPIYTKADLIDFFNKIK